MSGRFRSDNSRNFFTGRVDRHWNRMPGKAVEGFKNVDMALVDMIQVTMVVVLG